MDDQQKTELRRLARIDDPLTEGRLASSAAQGRMNKLAKVDPSAGHIMKKVFAAFQEANEIGGPDDPGSFSEMMEIIALEAKEQAKVARR